VIRDQQLRAGGLDQPAPGTNTRGQADHVVEAAIVEQAGVADLGPDRITACAKPQWCL
jgi:hypothetical protein